MISSFFTGCSEALKSSIRGYQRTLGPAKGYRCQFEPTCSQFAHDAIDRNGSFVGLLMWGDRSIRCHPFAYTNDKYEWVEVGESYHLSDPVQSNELFRRDTPNGAQSPWLAGALSAVLPGSGYVYAGRVSDGVSAFVKTGLWLGLAKIAWENEARTLAYGLGGVGGFYYASNIYGAANAATRDKWEPPGDKLKVSLFTCRW